MATADRPGGLSYEKLDECREKEQQNLRAHGRIQMLDDFGACSAQDWRI
jgi:hypothetical protein